MGEIYYIEDFYKKMINKELLRYIEYISLDFNYLNINMTSWEIIFAECYKIVLIRYQKETKNIDYSKVAEVYFKTMKIYIEQLAGYYARGIDNMMNYVLSETFIMTYGKYTLNLKDIIKLQKNLEINFHIQEKKREKISRRMRTMSLAQIF